MIARLTRRARSLMAGGALGVATIVATAAGADISFTQHGAFEACLNGAYAAWLRHQAELLVNQDKLGRSLNDASVVAWTASTLDDCRKKGEATPASMGRFRHHMVRWRDHIFEHAESIRRRGLSD